MAHHISKRELKMLERDRRENCGDVGYRYIQRRRVVNRVVTDRQRRKVERERRNNKFTKDTVPRLMMQDSIETRTSTSRRQRPTAAVRPVKNVSKATSKPVFQRPPRQSTSNKANVTVTATTYGKASGDIKAVHAGDICVRTKSDDYCNLTASVLLPDNKLVLADCKNRKLKLVNLRTSKVTSEIEAYSYPFDLTSITEDSVAVTVPNSKKILIVNVRGKLRLDRELSLNKECRAILHSNGHLVVSYVNPGKIEIMRMDGTAKRTIAHSKQFQWPHYMAISQDHETIYVSDFYGSSVTRLSLDGAVEVTFTDNDLMWPTGLVGVGQHGRLLVCGFISGTIHMLEPDLTKVKLILRDRDMSPRCLSYCHNTGILYVGMFESCNIKMYQLSLS